MTPNPIGVTSTMVSIHKPDFSITRPKSPNFTISRNTNNRSRESGTSTISTVSTTVQKATSSSNLTEGNSKRGVKRKRVLSKARESVVLEQFLPVRPEIQQLWDRNILPSLPPSPQKSLSYGSHKIEWEDTLLGDHHHSNGNGYVLPKIKSFSPTD